MKKFIPLAMLLFSCSQNNSEKIIATSPVDEEITKWEKNWNSHDSAGVVNLFAEDALLIDDKLIANNKSEIAAKWVHPNINLVTHFKSQQLKQWNTSETAGYTGKYDFDVTVKDSVIQKINGVYTVIWKINDKREWKVITAHINSIVAK
jgi:ketosteroid isomerase-like protein